MHRVKNIDVNIPRNCFKIFDPLFMDLQAPCVRIDPLVTKAYTVMSRAIKKHATIILYYYTTVVSVSLTRINHPVFCCQLNVLCVPNSDVIQTSIRIIYPY